MAKLADVMWRAHAADLMLRGKRTHDIQFQFMHAVEELGEAFKVWREGEFAETHTLDAYGLAHPEGLGSEIGDVLALAMILAVEIENQTGIDVLSSFEHKLSYVESKAMAKAVER